ncbi:glucosaminidase domain-containing protein [Marinobacter sp. BGYM27]|uniref:glucosaminidase domain-containing protein n=1 Tax=Marinobacter sp. BGYM27 TaxID=2975597 RepID=UPI0021A6BD9D|nr:glucosaminidase domain-containing protein [Marinobacter sp. BGYM27]MDG5499234.1 glucosaminidase domain-containing protein [Marinobacter sp. BGYM27]
MTAGTKLTAMVASFAIAFIWGTIHEPFPDVPMDQEDVVLDALPPLPDWARAELPDFTNAANTAEKKAAFFSFLYPRIALANTRVLMQRDMLEALERKDELSTEDKAWLQRQAKRLRIDSAPGSAEMFEMLDRRMDVISPSLIMAQAANESAWGTSRFAREGNNLFGQWCFSEGCGLVPLHRIEGASHEVASFDSPYESIRAYITNINRHPSYRALRNTREQARSKDKFPSGDVLAQGLIGYSERGSDYVREIQQMIHHNNLGYYDKQYQKLVGRDASVTGLLQLATGDESNLTPGGIAKNEG